MFDWSWNAPNQLMSAKLLLESENHLYLNCCMTVSTSPIPTEWHPSMPLFHLLLQTLQATDLWFAKYSIYIIINFPILILNQLIQSLQNSTCFTYINMVWCENIERKNLFWHVIGRSTAQEQSTIHYECRMTTEYRGDEIVCRTVPLLTTCQLCQSNDIFDSLLKWCCSVTVISDDFRTQQCSYENTQSKSNLAFYICVCEIMFVVVRFSWATIFIYTNSNNSKQIELKYFDCVSFANGKYGKLWYKSEIKLLANLVSKWIQHWEMSPSLIKCWRKSTWDGASN